MKILIISFFLLLTSVFLFLKDDDVSDELIVEEAKKEIPKLVKEKNLLLISSFKL